MIVDKIRFREVDDKVLVSFSDYRVGNSFVFDIEDVKSLDDFKSLVKAVKKAKSAEADKFMSLKLHKLVGVDLDVV